MLARACSLAVMVFTIGSVGYAQAVDGWADEVERLEEIGGPPSFWIVELSGAPTIEGGSPSALDIEKNEFRRSALEAGIPLVERFEFGTLFNGISVEVALENVATLRQLEGVKAIWPVDRVRLEQESDDGVAAQLESALGMTGADVAQSELGLTGAGVHVAIIDTGIDYDHPDLGGCFGPACRVVSGWDFVGDAYDSAAGSPTYDPVPRPDDDPDDCNGHGTHVAGILGARPASDGGIRGVAPDVTFSAYRVFGCTGEGSADAILAAMELAVIESADVLNMSLASIFRWPQSPLAIAARRTVNAGVVVVAAIGNNGQQGVYSTSAPGSAQKVIGVGSFENTHVAQRAFSVSPDGRLVGYAAAVATAPLQPPPAPPTSGTFTLARTGTSASTDDACTALAADSLAGKVALIRRGTCSFYIQARNAQSAGALGVVFYNNADGFLDPNVGGTPRLQIPAVLVSRSDGLVLDGRLAAGAVSGTWTGEIASTPNPAGGSIGSGSSYGLAPDLTFKPDIGAPGRFIRSTYPLEKGGRVVFSGTSMASPHVAGAAAILLEARPNASPSVIRALLMNTATPRPWWGNPASGLLDNAHRQGAGLVTIDDAARATSRIEPSALALGESEAGPAVRTLTIVNDSATEETYALGHAPALATAGSTFAPSFQEAFASVSFSPASVTVPAGASAEVEVKITPPAAPLKAVYGGYLLVTPGSAGRSYQVPYAGFIGDYQSITAVGGGGSGFPWLAKRVGSSFAKQAQGAAFTMTGGDVPYFLVHLDHPVRQLRLEVFDARTGRSHHRFVDQDFVGRNATATAFNAYGFGGWTSNGRKTQPLPNGEYVVRLSVLKALGDDTNPAHTEVWTSPTITIARP